MKRLIIYCCFILSVAASSAYAQQNSTSGYITINGMADNKYNGQTIIIYNNALSLTDSSKIANGKFNFKLPFKEPSRYFFYSKYEAKQKGGYAPYGILIAQPGAIGFNAQVSDMAASTVTGAPDNAIYAAYSKAEAKADEQMEQELAKKYGKDFSKHFDPKDSLYKEVSAYYEKLAAPVRTAQIQKTFEFIKQNQNSFAATYLLQTKANELSADSLELFYNQLGSKYKKSNAAKYILNTINAARATAIGKPAPVFEQADTAGKVVKLSDFRGKYVLLDFWASWCGPCRQENPNVVKAFERFHDKGFTVLGVSLDRATDKDKWLAAIHHDGLNWTQVSDLQFWKNAVAVQYGVNYIPQNFLIGPDGKIIAKGLQGEGLTKKLEELLSGK